MNKKSKLTAILVALTTMNLYNFITPVLAMNLFRFKIKEGTNQSDAYKNSPFNPDNLIKILYASDKVLNSDLKKIAPDKIIKSSEKDFREYKQCILIEAKQYLELYNESNSKELEPVKIPKNCSYSETMDYIILNYNRTDNKEFNEFSMACILYRLADHIKVPVVFITNYFKHVNIEIFWDQRNNDTCCGKKIRFFVIPNKNNQTNKSWDSLDIVQIMIPEKLKNLSYSKIYEMYSYWRSDSNLNLFDVLGNILNISNVPSATSSSLSDSLDEKYTVKNLNKMLGFNN